MALTPMDKTSKAAARRRFRVRGLGGEPLYTWQVPATRAANDNEDGVFLSFHYAYDDRENPGTKTCKYAYGSRADVAAVVRDTQNVPAGERRFFEQIRCVSAGPGSENPVHNGYWLRLYFDIEWYPAALDGSASTATSGERLGALLRIVRVLLPQYFPELRETAVSFYVTTSHKTDGSKYSYHVVAHLTRTGAHGTEEWLFANHLVIKWFVQSVLVRELLLPSTPAVAALAPLCVIDENRGTTLVDIGVYSKRRNMRLPGHHKALDEERPLRVMTEFSPDEAALEGIVKLDRGRTDDYFIQQCGNEDIDVARMIAVPPAVEAARVGRRKLTASQIADRDAFYGDMTALEAILGVNDDDAAERAIVDGVAACLAAAGIHDARLRFPPERPNKEKRDGSYMLVYDRAFAAGSRCPLLVDHEADHDSDGFVVWCSVATLQITYWCRRCSPPLRPAQGVGGGRDRGTLVIGNMRNHIPDDLVANPVADGGGDDDNDNVDNDADGLL